MKKLVLLLAILIAFGPVKAAIAKIQIADSGMTIANQESGTSDPTPPGGRNDG